jgi:L-malate glycosyltransferase
MSLRGPFKIFVPHCSDLLTDHRPHGDGLVAHGFIQRLAMRGHEIHVAVSEADLKVPMPSGVFLHLIEGTQKGAPWRRLRYMRQVRKLFLRLEEKRKFDLIHQLNPVYTGISLGLLGVPQPIILGPYISEWPDDSASHGFAYRIVRSLVERFKRTVAAWQQYYAGSLLLTTPAAAGRVIRRSSLSRTEMLPHGIDSDFFCPRDMSETEHLPFSSEAPEILFMANVGGRKGIYDLLHAFDRVAARYPKARLTVAGDGYELPMVKRAASALVAHDRVTFVGRLDRTGAVTLLQNADIYCLPSHGEPYGMTAVEAMSCGKPLVVTDAGGLGWLVDERGGLRVPVRDPQRLAEALSALIADPQRCRLMGEHNRARVLETMAWDRVIDRLEEIYSAAVRSKRNKRKNALPIAMPASSQGDCA